MKTPSYKMTISRLTVDKLGVKLYDKVSAVIAELIANSYDADATEVTVRCPMEEYLSTKTSTGVQDKGYRIEVEDNGIGMTPKEVNEFYLIVGRERRSDPKRGERSKRFKRKVMGRKGVGKLAPFGVCQKIEIITSGGKLRTKKIKGVTQKGYPTAHIILDKSGIIEDIDTPYFPSVGDLDQKLRPTTGTLVRLTQFDHRKVPSIEAFERALSQRFGLTSANWTITLQDLLKTDDDPEQTRTVGSFVVEKMKKTELTFKRTSGDDDSVSPDDYAALDPDGKSVPDLTAGFEYEGIFYPVTGWVAYSQKPYKDDLMAGIRVYCRGKIAAQTHIFNLTAGFTGEHDVRSYLIGELHADWLDAGEDLIRTDRQDILWSHDLGQAFEAWGQKVVKKIGVITRQPKKQQTWELFQEISHIRETVEENFPGPDQSEMRANTVDIAKVIVQSTKEEEIEDPEKVKSLVDLSLLIGPHITLDRNLRKAADDTVDALSVVVKVLRTARVAELAGFGKIAENRVKVIQKVGELKDDPQTVEGAFQELIATSPWLINPEWVPITSNQSFNTLKEEFQKYYKKKTGEDLMLDSFSDPEKRCDFVLSNQDRTIEIIEIKKPGHKLQEKELVRINKYVTLMEEFLKSSGNEEFKKLFPQFHVTLVCDGIGLSGLGKRAFQGLMDQGILSHVQWSVFLLRAKKAHEDFLNEAERQKRLASAK